MKNLFKDTVKDKVLTEEHPEEFLGKYLVLEQEYKAAIKEVTTKLEILDEEFKCSHEHNPIHHIETRLKSPKSSINKLIKLNKPLNLEELQANVKDIAGVRVVCNYIDDIYTIAHLLTNQSDIRLMTEKDYIANPKPNGYRSLHLVVTVPIFLSKGVKYVPVEVQIRTIAMDFWASLEHSLRYKVPTDTTKEIEKRLYDCAESISLVDSEMQMIHKTIQEHEFTGKES